VLMYMRASRCGEWWVWQLTKRAAWGQAELRESLRAVCGVCVCVCSLIHSRVCHCVCENRICESSVIICMIFKDFNYFFNTLVVMWVVIFKKCLKNAN